MDIDTIICGDNATVLQSFPDDCIDLTVTSPPYDNLRTYNGYAWDFEALARQLYRVTKPGGVVVWVVGDATVDGSETLTSFRQALYFKGLGFNAHDTMIWNKGGFSATGSLAVRYPSVFEFMFVFSKGFPKTFIPIKDHKAKHAGIKLHGNIRQADGSMRPISANKTKTIAEYTHRFNVWEIPPVKTNTAGGHPAPFPEAIARDHISTWSNPGDIVLDPFIGSGTTAKMAKETGRHWIGIDISGDYCNLARRRVAGANVPLFV
jgi:DNA modification methylase